MKTYFADILKIDSKEEYACLVNENRYEGEINSLDRVIDFLTKTYLNPNTKKQIENAEGIVIEEKPRMIEVKTTEETDRERKEKLYRFNDTENRTALVLALVLILFLILLLFLGN